MESVNESSSNIRFWIGERSSKSEDWIMEHGEVDTVGCDMKCVRRKNEEERQ